MRTLIDRVFTTLVEYRPVRIVRPPYGIVYIFKHVVTLGLILLVGPASSFGKATYIACKSPASDRYALVIGNAGYDDKDRIFDPLPKVENDRKDVAAALCELGFTVAVGQNQNWQEMRQAVSELKARTEQLVLVYFSGHGLQQDGYNYLIPIGAKIDLSEDLNGTAINASNIYDAVGAKSRKTGRVAIIILDACRSNVFSDKSKVIPGLAIPIDAWAGMTIAFATAPGSKVPSTLTTGGVDADHSPYTEFLLKYIEQPGLTLPELFAAVRNDVITSDSKEILWVPWENSSALVSTYLAKPVIVEWKVENVDDLVEVRVKGQPVVERTYPGKWEATLPGLLKPGPNPFEIRIYNAKTYRNGQAASGREGWHYNLLLRVQGGATHQFACSEDNPPEGRWGQVFKVYSGSIEISPKGVVSVSPPGCDFGK
jgi:hypothetical protein